MRRLASLLVVCLSASLLAQNRGGTYQKTPWSINDAHALIWGGQPYVPVGIRIDGSPSAVTAAHDSKVNDVIVDLPASGAGWGETLKALEEAKMRYLIRINSLAPMAHGFIVEPQGYRIAGIDKETHIELSMPGVDSAFVVLAAKRDGAISSQGRVPIINGKLVYDAKPGPQYEHVLLIYPETDSARLPNYWEAMDAHRDQLLSAVKKGNPGPGLRGIVNPIGRSIELPGRDLAFVPTSSSFRMELRNYLEQTYKSVQTATRSWSIGASDLESFEQIAKLVPLWNGDRGVAFFLDPTTNKTYPGDRRYSNAWADIANVIQSAGARRFDRLVSAIKTVADVPVVQEWAGWSSPYESERPAVDGIGMRSTGTTPSQVVESTCRATSSLLRWKSQGWLLATDIDLGSGDAAPQLPLVLDDLASLGAKGFFVRAEGAPVLKAIAAEIDRKAADTLLASTGTSALFYPENATNPANPQRLTGNTWWLPSPADGNRVDLGSHFYGYRMPNETVIWATKPGRYRLRMVDPKKAGFQTLDGSDPQPKQFKNGVEVMITQLPLRITGISEVPIPELAYIEAGTQFEEMMKIAQKLQRDVLEETLGFRAAMASFEQNPGGSFPAIRMEVYRLGYKIGDYVWQEGERTTTTNFSESALYPGASAGRVLTLDTAIDPGPEGYYAEYPIAVRTELDQEVWLAARIPAERRKDVTVFVGGQAFKMPNEPIALYGQGFGWYKLGTTRLAGNLSKVRISVPNSGALIAIDTVMLTPRPFVPSGVRPPLPIQENP